MRVPVVPALTMVAATLAQAEPSSEPSFLGTLPSAGGGTALSAGGTFSSDLGSFNIVIVPGTSLAANLPALAAFERAAATWESHLGDPVTVTINADLRNLGSPTILGQANTVVLVDTYASIRDRLVLDALNEADDSLVAALPTLAQFSFNTSNNVTWNQGYMGVSKANAKALGYAALDTYFGASDGTIEFNSAFAFDYDNSNGVGPGLIDFESVALHEIGHTLGFISEVDSIDVALYQNQSLEVYPFPLDLFRFASSGPNDPATISQFTTFPRELTPGQGASFDMFSAEYDFSTGRFNGDGRQASHWKDDALSGIFLGTMDPNLGVGDIFQLSTADLRSLDLIGWEVSAVPEPMGSALLPVLILTGICAHRSRSRRGPRRARVCPRA